MNLSTSFTLSICSLCMLIGCDEAPKPTQDTPKQVAQLEAQKPAEVLPTISYKPLTTVDPSNASSWVTFANPEIEKLYMTAGKWAQSSVAERASVEQLHAQIEALAKQQGVSPEQVAADLYYPLNAGSTFYDNPIKALLDKYGDKAVPWLMSRITVAPSKAERIFLFRRIMSQMGRHNAFQVISSRIEDSSIPPSQKNIWIELRQYLESLPK